MTLSSSGAISLGGSTTGRSVNLELGKSATAQISMNDTAVRTLAGKSSGAIVLPTDFYGKSASGLNIPSSPVNITQSLPIVPGYDASLGMIFISDGTYNKAANSGGSGTVTLLGTWVTPASANSDYEINASLTASNGVGTTNSATLNTWLQDPFNDFFGVLTDTAGQTCTRTYSIQVRKIGTTTVVGTFTVNVSLTSY